MDSNRHGVSRLHATIAVALILTLLALSAPHFLRASIAANENAARESLHTYNLALFAYWTTYETYPKALANLGAGSKVGVESADLLDPVLTSGKNRGYVFAYAPGELDFDGTTSTFSITATPSVPGLTGRQTFSMDQTGVVRASTNQSAVTSSTAP